MGVKRLRSPKNREAIKNIKLSFLNKLTPAKIDEYIEAQVVDLNSAKKVLKKIGHLLLYILKASNLQ